jgi:hypothetical protein
MCVDIGDSIYNGVHVPTDDLLVEVAESLGFRTIERVHLRNRVSKGGKAVRQQLLVFERPKILRKMESAASLEVRPKASSRVRTAGGDLPGGKEWEVFKKTLPHQLQPYAKREWGGPAHSMCSYQGR